MYWEDSTAPTRPKLNCDMDMYLSVVRVLTTLAESKPNLLQYLQPITESIGATTIAELLDLLYAEADTNAKVSGGDAAGRPITTYGVLKKLLAEGGSTISDLDARVIVREFERATKEME